MTSLGVLQVVFCLNSRKIFHQGITGITRLLLEQRILKKAFLRFLCPICSSQALVTLKLPNADTGTPTAAILGVQPGQEKR